MAISELIKISRHYGSNSEFVIAGGGNTSYKDNDSIWIKASGVSLAGIEEGGILKLSRKTVRELAYKIYPTDSNKREKLIKDDLISSIISSEKVYYRRCIPAVSTKRPSVETSLHEIFEHPFVVHTHPTVVNALLCSMKALEKTRELFGDAVLFIEYTDPGYTLFIKTKERLEEYRLKEKREPSIIFLENHGMIVGGGSAEEIQELSNMILDKISDNIKFALPDSMGKNKESSELLIAVNRRAKVNKLETSSAINELIETFVKDRTSFGKVAIPMTPDDIVYCKSEYLFLSVEVDDIDSEIDRFVDARGYFPRIIAIEKYGLLACAESKKEATIALEIFINMMKVSYLSMNFGGPKFLSENQIEFIDNWESENYRRNLSKG